MSNVSSILLPGLLPTVLPPIPPSLAHFATRLSIYFRCLPTSLTPPLLPPLLLPLLATHPPLRHATYTLLIAWLATAPCHHRHLLLQTLILFLPHYPTTGLFNIFRECLERETEGGRLLAENGGVGVLTCLLMVEEVKSGVGNFLTELVGANGGIFLQRRFFSQILEWEVGGWKAGRKWVEGRGEKKRGGGGGKRPVMMLEIDDRLLVGGGGFGSQSDEDEWEAPHGFGAPPHFEDDEDSHEDEDFGFGDDGRHRAARPGKPPALPAPLSSTAPPTTTSSPAPLSGPPPVSIMVPCLLELLGRGGDVVSKCLQVINPKPTVPKYQVYLRRTPTQDEFFPRAIKGNPIGVSEVPTKNKTPDFADLRDHIAELVGMAESSAMIELLVSGKIISTALSITKVQETIWREFVLSNNSSSEAASSEVKSFSMEQFPPMVVTYRLTGLDGEATEDVVDKLGEEEATNAADLYANADYVTGPGLQTIVDTTTTTIARALAISRRDNTPASLPSTCPPALILLKCCLSRPACAALISPPSCSSLVSLLMRLITSSPPSDGDSVTMNTLVECIQLSTSQQSAAPAVVAVDRAAGAPPSMMRMMLTSLNQEQFRTLLRSTPTLIDVVGRLIPTFITAENSQTLAETLSAQISSFPLDTLGLVYLSIASNTTEPTFVSQLLASGFINSVTNYVCDDAPKYPPPTTPSLHSPGTVISETALPVQKAAWGAFLAKPDLVRILKCLTHLATFQVFQNFVTTTLLIKVAHWVSATSVSGDAGIEAEKFMEQIILDNETTGAAVKALQTELQTRKKVIADKKRNEALAKTSSAPSAKPAWMTEMEGMDEDEDPITCCTCSEGYSYSDGVLALYSHASRVSISNTGMLEGNSLFSALPPTSAGLAGSLLSLWMSASNCKEYNKYLVNNTKTLSLFSTTSASVAIHIACHTKAVKADRNHSKAPKSEWEGSTLRNNRAKCNTLLPLRKSSTSATEFMEACEKYFANISSVTGVSTPPTSSSASVVPRTQLCVHDLRLLIDTFAKGHSVSELSQGGSISSNSHLLLRLVMFARSTAESATHNGEPGPSRARALPSAFMFAASQNAKSSTLPPASTFAACAALCFETSKFWRDNKRVFLQQLVRDKSPGGPSSGGRSRSSSFNDWDAAEGGAGGEGAGGKRKRADDHTAVRARLLFFLLVDCAFNCVGDREIDDDQEYLDLAEDLADRVNVLHKCKTIEELWRHQTTSLQLGKILEDAAA